VLNKTLSLLGINKDDLIKDDHTLPLKIADMARKLGYEAIISPSATGVGKNLNIYLDMLREDSSVRVDDIDILKL